jgi:type I restriction enzyme R subunit
MAVCMTRENCVRLYDALTALPGCPEIKVVMTGNLSEDPPDWSEAGHLTTKAQRESIKERLREMGDPLRMVIVCDMWLTGTDIPWLHTLYLDKPMRGHNMIQAISPVPRGQPERC